jgi:hypothetical protein
MRRDQTSSADVVPATGAKARAPAAVPPPSTTAPKTVSPPPPKQAPDVEETELSPPMPPMPQAEPETPTLSVRVPRRKNPIAPRVPLRAIKTHLFPDGDDPFAEEGVYAVVDGANCPDLLDKLYDPDSPPAEFACLYSGDLGPDMAEVAPYLVKLDPSSPFTDWLVREGWGHAWCIYLACPFDLRTVRRHLRTFLMVYDPDGKPMYFRYYDPRVLRVYLPTCNAEETKLVFGPLRSFMMEDEERSVLLRFTPQGATPRQESVILFNDGV